MNINKLARLMSDKNKSRIIAHFFTCNCHKYDVNAICNKLNIEQSLMSKHLSSLKKLNVLGSTMKSKKNYYFMKEKFKNQWGPLIKPMVNHTELEDYQCQH